MDEFQVATANKSALNPLEDTPLYFSINTFFPARVLEGTVSNRSPHTSKQLRNNARCLPNLTVQHLSIALPIT